MLVVLELGLAILLQRLLAVSLVVRVVVAIPVVDVDGTLQVPSNRLQHWSYFHFQSIFVKARICGFNFWTYTMCNIVEELLSCRGDDAAVVELC